MKRKEMRISEIMEKEKVDSDTAESLFLCELEDKYSDCGTEDIDLLEMLYETEPYVKQKTPKTTSVFTSRHEAAEFCNLIGFKLESVEDAEEDCIHFTFRNEHNVKIAMLFDGQELFVCEPYGVDKDGIRIC